MTTPKTLPEFLAETADQNQSDAPWELENERILTQLGLHLLEYGIIAPRNRYSGTFCNEELRGREADATGTARDQR